MKYIITEDQADYKEKWDKFVNFMRRRRKEIIDLIDNNILTLSEYHEGEFTVGTVVKWTGDDITIHNEIEPDSDKYDWVYIYLEDYYGDIIKEKMEKYKRK